MNTIKANWKYILLFVFFFMLTIFFHLTNNDWIWVIGNKVTDFKSFIDISQGRLLSSSLVLLLVQSKFLKVVTYSILSLCMFILIRNIVNKKNRTLLYIAIFLFFLLNSSIITTAYVSINGFCNFFMSCIFMLIILNFLTRDTLYKLSTTSLFTLGLVSTILTPITTIALLITITYLLIIKYLNKEKDESLHVLFDGMLTGTVIMLICLSYYVIPDLSFNILHVIIPAIYDVNFIVTLILIAFLLYLCIKIYTKGNRKIRTNTILSIGAVTTYSIAHILSTNDISNYLLYIFFNMASIYILLHANNSYVFKNKIRLYYLFKFTYLIALIFISNITPAHMLFLSVIDIIIILELVNYVFPNNFLEIPWIVVLSLIFITNIYIYESTYYRNREMERYIKNHLECAYYEFDLPQRYIKSHTDNYLPYDKESRKLYGEYLGLEIDSDYTIRINK